MPLATPIPASTIENSPRGISVSAVRNEPLFDNPDERADIQPDAIFVPAPTMASRIAGTATSISDDGATSSPKYTKNNAANASRNGTSISRARSAT